MTKTVRLSPAAVVGYEAYERRGRVALKVGIRGSESLMTEDRIRQHQAVALNGELERPALAARNALIQ